jgi:hypothetical protein
LLGYKNNGSNFYTSFVYLLFDYAQNQFFSGNKRRIEIGNMLNVSQTEGITFESSTSGYISAEKITSSLLTVSPKLFQFDFTSYFENPTSFVNPTNEYEINVYPIPANEFIQIDLPENSNQPEIKIKDFLNRRVSDQSQAVNENKIDIRFLQNGVYFLELNYNNRTVIIPFIKE